MSFFKANSKPKKKHGFFSEERENQRIKTFEVQNEQATDDGLAKQVAEDDKKYNFK